MRAYIGGRLMFVANHCFGMAQRAVVDERAVGLEYLGFAATNTPPEGLTVEQVLTVVSGAGAVTSEFSARERVSADRTRAAHRL